MVISDNGQWARALFVVRLVSKADSIKNSSLYCLYVPYTAIFDTYCQQTKCHQIVATPKPAAKKNNNKKIVATVSDGEIFIKRSNIRRPTKRYGTNHTNYVLQPATLADCCVHKINLASCCP